MKEGQVFLVCMFPVGMHGILSVYQCVLRRDWANELFLLFHM